MSLFNRTKTTYNSSTSLIFDQEAKGLIEQTVFGSVLQNRNIAEDLRANIAYGLLFKANRMYGFGLAGETDPVNGYYLGLPQGTLSYNPTAPDTELKVLIEAETSQNIVLIGSIVDKDFTASYAEEYLFNVCGWDPVTGIVSTPPFDPLGEIVTYNSSEILADNLVGITFDYDINQHTENIVVDLVQGDLYYYVTYYVLDDQGKISGVPIYWRYRENLGTYPELDIPTEAEDLTSPYYPIIPLRENQVDVVDSINKVAYDYRSKERCLHLLGIDIDDIATAINESPDIDDVDHTYVMLGVHVSSQKDSSKEYLYRFFNKLRSSSKVDKYEFDYWEYHYRRDRPPPVNRLEINDASYKVEMAWNYIGQEVITGSIGPVGTYTSFVESRPVRYVEGVAPIENDPEGTGGGNNDPEGTGVGSGIEDTFIYEYPDSSLVIRKQITATEYIELDVRGLVHLNYIYGNNAVKTDVDLSFGADDEKHNFIIPLNRNLVREMGAIKTHDLMYDSVRLVFNSRIRTKLAWYQTGIFRVILVVIVVVVSIVTEGATLAEGIALLGSTELLLNTLVQVLIQQLVAGKIISYAADLFGEEFALLLNIISVAYGVHIAQGGIVSTVTASSLLNATITGVSSITSLQLQKEAQSIMNESERLDAEIKEYEESINLDAENVLDILNTNMEMVRKYDVVQDAPSYYYKRRIHTGNVGVLSLDATEHFVNSHLRLDLPYTPVRTTVY